MDGFPSLEVIGVMETNSYIYGQGRGPCSSTALRAKATACGAQPFHSEQLTCPGSKAEGPACKPAAGSAADTICLPCLYKSCSS